MPRTLIIGAGHNGLVCTAFLARAGHQVTVLERADRPGGCTVTEEVVPGFRFNTGAIELEGLVHSGIDRELGLAAHGLRWIPTPHLLAAQVGGETAIFHRDLGQTLASITERFGAPAAEEWKRFAAFSDALMSAVGSLQHVKTPGMGGLTDILGRLGPLGPETEAVMRTVFAPSGSVLDEWLTYPALRAAATAFSTHPQMPPWVPGSGVLACLLASSHGHPGARAVGGTGAVVTALQALLRSLGGEVRCGAVVREVRVQGGRVTGVALDSGEVIGADVVVPTVDLKRVAAMLPPELLTTPWQRALRSSHSGLFNIGEIKVDAALDRVPVFANDPSGFAGTLRYLMHRSDVYTHSTRAVMGGRIPAELPLMVVIPSGDDPSQCPAGKATLWASGFVPAEFSDGRSWPAANEEAADAVFATLERFSPGITASVIGRQVTGPSDWERRLGNRFGNPNHVDMTIDQLFSLRPAPGFARHRTPVPGLYLSGAGTHPGGGVHGMPGKLAAEAVLADQRGERREGQRPALFALAKAAWRLRKAL